MARFLRFRRFSTQLLLLLAGLFGVVQVSVFLLIARANQQNAIAHAEQNLRIGARLFRQALQERIEYLAGSARVMSNDYAIKPLLIQQELDRASLSSALDSYTQRVDAPVIALFSPEAALLAANEGPLEAGYEPAFGQLIRQAVAGDQEEASAYAHLGNGLHVLVVVPLYAPYPEIGGWFGIAYPIDQAFAQGIKNTARLDVTFLSGFGEPRGRVLSSTLPPSRAAGLVRAAGGASAAVADPAVTIIDGEYVTLFEAFPLLGSAPARIALQRSLDEELAAAHELERTVLFISMAALLGATALGFMLARGVSRPVRELAAHARAVAGGDYSPRVHLPRTDELGQLATAFNEMTAGLAERDRVRNLLGMVVSPEIATQLLQSDLKLGGEEREVTILFCDLRDFTALSERLSPTEVLTLLNRYLHAMSVVIERNGGVIDKYMGDAVMALFGAPVAQTDAPARALNAAREMAAALARLNAVLIAEGKPKLSFGVGINTARVVAGNVGSRSRLNYTVIGDGVNVAARLEALTKDAARPSVIIVSEATLERISPRPPAAPLGEVAVKGRAAPVRVYSVEP